MVLPDYVIFPPNSHSVERRPDGGGEILVPVLVPGEQLSISYIYLPPVKAGDVNTGVKSDEGIATPIRVIPQRQAPRWLHRAMVAIELVGLAAVIYIVWAAGGWMLSRM